MKIEKENEILLSHLKNLEKQSLPEPLTELKSLVMDYKKSYKHDISYYKKDENYDCYTTKIIKSFDDFNNKLIFIKKFICENSILDKICVNEFTGRRRRLSMIQKEECLDYYEKKFKELQPMILDLELQMKRSTKLIKDNDYQIQNYKNTIEDLKMLMVKLEEKYHQLEDQNNIIKDRNQKLEPSKHRSSNYINILRENSMDDNSISETNSDKYN